MNMCKYCCKKSRSIIQEINNRPDEHYSMCHVSCIGVSIDGDNLMVKALDTETYFEIESQTKINFCPMCGRKLKE